MAWLARCAQLLDQLGDEYSEIMQDIKLSIDKVCASEERLTDHRTIETSSAVERRSTDQNDEITLAREKYDIACPGNGLRQTWEAVVRSRVGGETQSEIV